MAEVELLMLAAFFIALLALAHDAGPEAYFGDDHE
jgi:hypothetical protein